MAENAHRCCLLQVVSRTPEVWAKGNSRCHHTFTGSGGSGLLPCIRSGVSSPPLHASPSQLPATLSDVVYGATWFRQREQPKNNDGRNRVSRVATAAESARCRCPRDRKPGRAR